MRRVVFDGQVAVDKLIKLLVVAQALLGTHGGEQFVLFSDVEPGRILLSDFLQLAHVLRKLLLKEPLRPSLLPFELVVKLFIAQHSANHLSLLAAFVWRLFFCFAGCDVTGHRVTLVDAALAQVAGLCALPIQHHRLFEAAAYTVNFFVGSRLQNFVQSCRFELAFVGEFHFGEGGLEP